MRWLLPAAVWVAGCTLGEESGPEPGPEPGDDVCADIVGASFTSESEHECGLTPDGVYMCHWTISFDADEFHALYSDISETSAYQCEDGVLTAEGHTGEYEPDNDLTWDGIEYNRDGT